MAKNGKQERFVVVVVDNNPMDPDEPVAYRARNRRRAENLQKKLEVQHRDPYHEVLIAPVKELS